MLLKGIPKAKDSEKIFFRKVCKNAHHIRN